ncbi:MAG: serine hydrolase [Flavobacteriaceae bacterium]|nr:serine hydrolase [Flavobacteriaceae bacterium]
MAKPILSVFIISLGIFIFSCSESTPLEQALTDAELEVKKVLYFADEHEIQIRYTQIKRGENNLPEFSSYSLFEDSEAYFYPASTAKLPIAALALQRIRELQAEGININSNTPFHIRDRYNHPIALKDSTALNENLSVAHLIKKIFLVSDNDSYNFLFDFLGSDYINSELRKKGLSETSIHHKFLFGADNQTTWEYHFIDHLDTLYYQPSIRAKQIISNGNLKAMIKGIGYIDGNELVNRPFDFSSKNRISINDLEGILKRILFPNVFDSSERFDLLEEDYKFLKFWMSRNTLESSDPDYSNNPDLYDSYVKFFVYGDQKGAMTDNVRIFNKVGDAYGTLTETAYIQDRASAIEFLLTATVHVNENQIFNDNIYEYDSIGFPFMAGLGRAILNYEKNKR